MYTNVNFMTLKSLRDAVKAGDNIGVHQPGGLFPTQMDGVVTLEGPHSPEPHKWYCRALIEDGIIVKLLK